MPLVELMSPGSVALARTEGAYAHYDNVPQELDNTEPTYKFSIMSKY